MKRHRDIQKGTEQRRMQYEIADMNTKLILNVRNLSHTMHLLYEGKGSQKRILIILKETGTITQRELTERLGIQPGSASEVITKLENAGLVCRTPSREDRRTVDIALTESGKKSAEEAAEQREQRHEEMFACLDDEEKETLLNLLEKLSDDWGQRYPEMRLHGKRRRVSCGNMSENI